MSAIPPEQQVDAGRLGSSGSPCIKVKVWGAFPASAQEFEPIIDTGFTGFLSMPLVQALPLGLILVGTTRVTLADGSTDTKLTALGTIQLESGVNKVGVVILEPNSSDLLVGMEFLTLFERTLLLFGERAIPEPVRATAKQALLIDNTMVRSLLEMVGEYVKKTAEEQAAREAQKSQTTLALGDQGKPEDTRAPDSPSDPPPKSN